jgi:hypothetical protein
MRGLFVVIYALGVLGKSYDQDGFCDHCQLQHV